MLLYFGVFTNKRSVIIVYNNRGFMNGLFLAGGYALSAFTSWLGATKLKGSVKFKNKTYELSSLVRKLFAVLIFLVYTPYLFMLEEIIHQTGLVGLESPVSTVLLVTLKWLTYFSVAACMVEPFFKKQSLSDFVAFFVPVILVLNAVFLAPWSKLVTGTENLYDVRIILYSVTLALMAGVSGSGLISKITDKEFSNIGKRILKAALFMLLYLPAFLPAYYLKLTLGETLGTTAEFSVTHRILIYTCVLFILGGIYFMKDKSEDEKRVFLILLSISGFMQYFSINAVRSPLSYPLHLCNTAIVLMMFAYIFKLQGVFYFTYLVNVLGAFLAVLLPNTGDDLLTGIGPMIYWYNHTYAFVLPIFGVALKIFPRPNLKLVKKAIIAFSCYVLAAATLNAWLNNSPINTDHVLIDYFFLYGDFFIDKFAFAIPIKYEFILEFELFGTTFVFYYMYILAIWGVFVVLMFAIWGFYALMYRTADAMTELNRRKKLMMVDHQQLLKELNGRSPKEPLHPEGANMIRIKNFSKTYAGSTKKAVEDVNLEIHEGEVFGFIGHNGAGKSTTIKSLVGIQSITEGSIEIQGYDIARQPLEAKLQMGYVSDNHAVYENLTGREYISYVADLYMVSEKDKNERIEKYAKMFHLENALDSEIKCYSHGMKQKTMVIGALIHNPKVWILDEPLTGLDPTSSWQIKECMRQHADEGNIVFFSSHVIEVVEKVCDRIAIISSGKICRVSKVEDIQKEGLSLEQLYLQYANGSNSQDKESR